MIKKIEALNFRCLRYIDRDIPPFVALVGPNASGKTTFIDVLRFISDVLKDGVSHAVSERTSNPMDMIWGRSGDAFELAVEAVIPPEIKGKLPTRKYDDVRYELKIGVDRETHEPSIASERVFLKTDAAVVSDTQRTLFPTTHDAERPTEIYRSQISRTRFSESKTVVHKKHHGNDNFYSELFEGGGKGWLPSFKFGPQKSALANIPDDGTRFPVSTWLREFFLNGIRSLVLNSLIIRHASPPGLEKRFVEDGSNLPWVIERVRTERRAKFDAWLSHIRIALPDIQSISTVERPDDKHRYLVVHYNGGIDVPSWMVSDGTLRFLALTLISYLPETGDLYLIEEPENGIHPRAIESLYQSLSSVYNSQLIAASHSPVMLGLISPDQVLCFAKSQNETDIVSGTNHPALREWKGECSLGVLFASGILG